MQQALVLSLKAAALATAIALVLGSLARSACTASRFFGREAISFLLRAADRAARDHHRHGAQLVLRLLEVQLRALDDRDRPRDLLRRRRLQQRDRPAAARARLADRGVDGPRRRRLSRRSATSRFPTISTALISGGAARVRAVVRRGDRDDVHRRRPEHAADLDLRPDPPRPAAARGERRRAACSR